MLSIASFPNTADFTNAVALSTDSFFDNALGDYIDIFTFLVAVTIAVVSLSIILKILHK